MIEAHRVIVVGLSSACGFVTLLLLTVIFVGGDREAPVRVNSVVVQINTMIPMRDGVRLATDLYLPAQNDVALPGPFYALLVRTPYNKTESAIGFNNHAKRYALSSYVVIYQDVRGRYASEGSFTKYTNEGPDGYDTIAWILQQPWSNGKVGMFGTSYLAHSAMAAACLAPPGLAAMLLDEGGISNAYRGGIRTGGAFELKQVTWAFKQAKLSPEVFANPRLQASLQAINLKDWFNSTEMPWRVGDSPLQWTPDYDNYVNGMWTHGTFDSYWKQIGLYAQGYYDVIPDIPQLHISAWYDPYTQTASDNYIGMNDIKRSPIQLILGSWLHGAGAKSDAFSGDVDFGPNATFNDNLGPGDFAAFRLRWFDHYMRGIDNAESAVERVRVFVMGGGPGTRSPKGRLQHGGRWRFEKDWPLPSQVLTQYYLHFDGALNTDVPTWEETGAVLSYVYNPADPVPSIGGAITSGAPVMEGGAFNQVTSARFFPAKRPYGPLADRKDVLVFRTPPLAKNTEVTGVVKARLWIRSNCTDTDFAFKLIDEYPPSEDYPQGYAMNLNDGILRVRYRDNGWADPKLMTPGQVYAIEVEAPATANVFVAGHRIRVDISSSSFPHYDLNPNTGEPEGRSTYNAIAFNEIMMNTDHPSHLVLPIIP